MAPLSHPSTSNLTLPTPLSESPSTSTSTFFFSTRQSIFARPCNVFSGRGIRQSHGLRAVSQFRRSRFTHPLLLLLTPHLFPPLALNALVHLFEDLVRIIWMFFGTTKMSMACRSETSLASLVCLVHLVSLIQPNKPDRPNRQNELDRLADFFSIILDDSPHRAS